ncbi:hypothetical protein PybrP1_001474 [[Pythium] brassicae (nom. inval.)]|nr:hypothetical protein PybrP1_001474 [[Pythium] brassicae (nom. inval.)]
MAARRVVRLEEYASTGAAPAAALVPRSSRTVDTRVPASASHRQNDKYMEAFGAAHEELHAAATRSSATRSPATTTREATTAGGKAVAIRKGVPSSRTSGGPAAEDDGKLMTPAAPTVGELDGAWLRGPAVPEGALHAVSAQPLMCMSMSADGLEVVVGSSDHALYVIPLGSGGGPGTRTTSSSTRSVAAASKPRTLYSKKFGHAEWVTCVAHLPDNRVVSGGMDSKLCLWDAAGVRCDDLLGHSGSVSLVQPLGDELLVSAGYDKTVRVWSVGKHTPSRQRARSSVKAGTAPILDASLLLGGRSLVCGDRDGSVHVVDLEDARVRTTLSGAHKGHATSVLGSRDGAAPVFFSGGQDGVVNVWDAREQGPVHALALHVDAHSGKRGAVGFLRESPEADANVLVTGGADGVVNVLDKRASFHAVHTFAEHQDFVYALALHGQLCLSGAGNGMLHVHDWKRGTLLYGLGANQAAVRAVAATRTQLVAAGDDGGVVVYSMQ